MIRVALIFYLLATLLSVTNGQVAPSKDDEENRNSIEQSLAELREIVCVEAANFDSPIHDQAFAIVRENNFTDERFNDVIRAAMVVNADSEKDQGSLHRVSVAVKLMPHSTLDDVEKVSLCLQAVQVESDRFAEQTEDRSTALRVSSYSGGRIPVREVARFIDDYPAELAGQLKPIVAKNRTALACAVAALTGEHGIPLLPFLLEAAKSDRRAVRLAALASANHILAPVREREFSDDRYLRYAQRIVARYDDNQDQALTEPEWSKMLMAPTDADTNRDGIITLVEYAEFLSRRQQR